MKGVQDIRIMVGLFRNLKVINLKERLGGDGVCSLIQLWCYAAEQMPKGILGVLPPEVIEYFSGWTGSKGEFVKVLLELRLLEKQGDTFSIHDWEENQPWAYHSDARSDQAKAAIAKRWKKNTRRNTNSITHRNSDSNTPSPIPLPTPLPIPKELSGSESKIIEWLMYKAEKGQKYKPTGLKSFFSMLLKKFPTAESRNEAIDSSMMNNYAGVFPAKGGEKIQMSEAELIDRVCPLKD